MLQHHCNAITQDRHRSIAVDGMEVSPRLGDRHAAHGSGISTASLRDDGDDDGLAGSPRTKDLDTFAQVGLKTRVVVRVGSRVTLSARDRGRARIGFWLGLRLRAGHPGRWPRRSADSQRCLRVMSGCSWVELPATAPATGLPWSFFLPRCCS